MYNIWSESKTKNGFASDEIISSFQKAVRRAMEEEACQYAYELYISGPVFLDKLWRRIMAISVEDIGFGNLLAPGQIHTLFEMKKNYPYDDVDQPIYFVHAIRILCQSQKDRSSDYLKNIIIKEASLGKLPEIMDVGLDKHTKRGLAMGRGSKHFFEEGTKVIPQLQVENNYRERYGKILESYDPKDALEDSFKFNGQY